MGRQKLKAYRSGGLGRLCRRRCVIHYPSLYILHGEPASLGASSYKLRLRHWHRGRRQWQDWVCSLSIQKQGAFSRREAYQYLVPSSSNRTVTEFFFPLGVPRITPA